MCAERLYTTFSKMCWPSSHSYPYLIFGIMRLRYTDIYFIQIHWAFISSNWRQHLKDECEESEPRTRDLLFLSVAIKLVSPSNPVFFKIFSETVYFEPSWAGSSWRPPPPGSMICQEYSVSRDLHGYDFFFTLREYRAKSAKGKTRRVKVGRKQANATH